MKFVIAPDKFKGSLTGFEFCDAVAEGLRSIFPHAEIVKMPLADGGDGTMEVVRHYLKGEKITIKVHDPLFRPVDASYLYSGKTDIAYIEMAEASGLKLLGEEERNCLYTTTLGTGELMADAIRRGAKELILGIGGSATNDVGIGMATALGFRFMSADEALLKPVGENLSKVSRIDASSVLDGLDSVSFKVACDVTNPLYGPNGAAHVYAKQKGASEEAIAILDQGLRHFAKIVSEQCKVDLQQMKGAGAAGGLGAGAHLFLGAQLTSGIDLVKAVADFDTVIEGADWIITGEGRLDSQTLSGKTINGVIQSAVQRNIPVAALCGSVDITMAEQEALGLTYVSSITRGITNLQEAMKSSYGNLVFASYNFAKLLR
ncbi:glycerate kinase [Flavobacteriaceae bacterium TP-CH-4]|uniref:Glycerate kinase n=1 Tax=Pelagihabitans pacificus TaxID=2696054 RepID=A0A967E4S1_9FLAO|nr:glycerate kinase [Pelagihabitans pacificus]NHF57825.1 glycerate kinase [Pelagihabitans pacificus]